MTQATLHVIYLHTVSAQRPSKYSSIRYESHLCGLKRLSRSKLVEVGPKSIGAVSLNQISEKYILFNQMSKFRHLLKLHTYLRLTFVCFFAYGRSKFGL